MNTEMHLLLVKALAQQNEVIKQLNDIARHAPSDAVETVFSRALDVRNTISETLNAYRR